MKYWHLLRKLRFTKADQEKVRGWQITGQNLALLHEDMALSHVTLTDAPLSKKTSERQKRRKRPSLSSTSMRRYSDGGGGFLERGLLGHLRVS